VRSNGALALFPLLGEVIPEAPQFGIEIRHLIHGNYRIFYLFSRERVSIVRIIHAARQITAEMFGLDQREKTNG
jgi:plasmid stabilization system protein ParE